MNIKDMLVELKKVKISSGIIKQIQPTSNEKLIPENVIGWVFYKFGKYFYHTILLYDKEKNNLSSIPMSVSITVNLNTQQTKWVCKYTTSDGFRTIESDSEQESLAIQARLIEMNRKAKEIGQIFY